MKPTFEINRTEDGRFMFALKAEDNQVILTSQTYATREAAARGIAAVKHNAALGARYEHKAAGDGASYFLLRAGNRLVIGRSQIYSSLDAMLNGIESVKRAAPVAELVDLSIDQARISRASS